MTGRWRRTCSCIQLLGLLIGTTATAQNILSIEGGYLTFTNADSTLYYTVESRPGLTDRSSWDGSYSGLKDIHSTNSTITVPVGVFYRVVGRSQPTTGARPPKSGQTVSYGSRDDGALQAGTPWPEPRFSDNEDGTVTDHLGGLVWLKNANAFGTRDWTNALADCSSLSNGVHGLIDGSAAGDWRLPSSQELLRMVDWGRSDPALPSGHPFTGVRQSFYWSQTARAGDDSTAWVVNMDVGDLFPHARASVVYVWPVRDLPRFRDNGDGTVTDTTTGLVWLQDAGALGALSWQNALAACNGLADGMHGLSDGSAAGDWRLPNLVELHSLVEQDGAPVIQPRHAFENLAPEFYWSSTTYRHSTGSAWTMNLTTGIVTGPGKTNTRYVLAVRQRR